MTMPSHLPLGIIEGFFGASWDFSGRRWLAGFLAQKGYDFYIYAPKSDACLRRHWREDWPEETFQSLLSLRQTYREAGIRFGLGLSPLDLCTVPNGEGAAALVRKVERLNALRPDILCLLFDDMRGDIPKLAQTQAELATEAADATCAEQVILCPTYYSDDPVLERVFGTKPEKYLEALGSLTDPATDIFWTGPQVCSEHYNPEHLISVEQRLGRKPFLWDNYPVNDGAVKSRHLHLYPFNRDRAEVAPHVAGHAVNPMNQLHLSLPALASLPLAYRQKAHYEPVHLSQTLLIETLGETTGLALARDIDLFHHQGLDAISGPERAALIANYQALPDCPAIRELIGWLRGDYLFDPACLTD